MTHSSERFFELARGIDLDAVAQPLRGHGLCQNKCQDCRGGAHAS